MYAKNNSIVLGLPTMEVEFCPEWEEWKQLLQVIKGWKLGSEQGYKTYKMQTC
jgi:hypothetical protein